MTSEPGSTLRRQRAETRRAPEPQTWGQAIARFLVISAILALVVFVAVVAYLAHQVSVGF